MESLEIKAYQCPICHTSYVGKLRADNCCKPKLCEDCGCELPKSHGYTVCDECRNKREEKRELERYNKATHYTFATAPKESIEYLYSEKYPFDDGYMLDVEDDRVGEFGIKYVYGTNRVSPSYDASDIVESMLEESYEDAMDHVNSDETAKLQEAIDTFIKNHGGCLDWFEVDYSVVIDL